MAEHLARYIEATHCFSQIGERQNQEMNNSYAKIGQMDSDLPIRKDIPAHSNLPPVTQIARVEPTTALTTSKMTRGRPKRTLPPRTHLTPEAFPPTTPTVTSQSPDMRGCVLVMVAHQNGRKPNQKSNHFATN